MTEARPAPPAGILVVDKPAGCTSHDVVAWARRALRTREVGHAGTLDPAATGVLVLLLGDGTRLSAFVTADEKSYEATVRFGEETDSLDADGAVVATGPAEVSTEALRDALENLQRQHPELAMTGVGTDFSRRLALPAELLGGPSLVFYPGSSIGNFLPAAALRLLREARAAAAGGALLIGADLIKPAAVLDAAYDDALGVTAAFNLNLLRHLNRLLGADFSVRQWRHVAFYDPAATRREMHHGAREARVVRWPGGERRFAAGERIHTEYSCKWAPADFIALLREAGFSRVRHWTDPQDWFGVFLAAG